MAQAFEDNKEVTSSKVSNLKLILLLFCLTIGFFWKAAILKEVFFHGDIMVWNYPIHYFFAESIKSGRLFLWCPYISSGSPLFAEGAAGVFYPLNLLLFSILPTWVALNFTIILHIFLAGVFMYFFLKVIDLNKISSLIGALTFMFSGFLVARIVHINISHVCIWLPLVFGLLELGIRTNKKIYFVFTGLVIGVQFLGGHMQFSVYILLAIFLWFIFRSIQIFGRSRKAEVIKLGGRLLLAMCIGMGIAAIQIIPLYEFFGLSRRAAGLSYEEATACSFSFKDFITFLMPTFFGTPADGTCWTADAIWLYWEYYAYAGIAPLLLSFIAIVSKKRKWAYFFIALVLVSLFLSLGRNNPFYGWLYNFIPLFRIFRMPGRALFLYTFAISGLAALGFDLLYQNDLKKWIAFRLSKILLICALLGISLFIFTYLQKNWLLSRFLEFAKVRYSNPGVWRGILFDDYPKLLKLAFHQVVLPNIFRFLWLSLSIIVLFLAYIRGLLRRHLFGGLVILVIIYDLFLSVGKLAPTIDPKIYLSQPDTVRLINKDGRPFRVFHWEIYRLFFSRDWLQQKKFCQRNIGVLPPEFCLIHGVSSIEGVFGLGLQCYREVEKNPQSRIIDLLNGKYIISSVELKVNKLELIHREKDYRIYENKDALPRAFIVYKAKVIKDCYKRLKELNRKDFNPEEYIILEEEVDIKSKQREHLSKEESKAHIVKYLSDEVVIKANLSRAGFLVLSDTYYPGWKAYVDGKETKIYKTNHLVRSIYLPEGEHEVEFIYTPLSFKVGLVITLLTFLSLITTAISKVKSCT